MKGNSLRDAGRSDGGLPKKRFGGILKPVLCLSTTMRIAHPAPKHQHAASGRLMFSEYGMKKLQDSSVIQMEYIVLNLRIFR